MGEKLSEWNVKWMKSYVGEKLSVSGWKVNWMKKRGGKAAGEQLNGWILKRVKS